MKGDDPQKGGRGRARGNYGISEERNGSRDEGVPVAVLVCARQEQQLSGERPQRARQ